ncbi:MAG: dehydrogenase E1 component subunit alpha/beta [Rhodothermaceae bacterium]|nr:dehydrogenase E1 component subunit alpha/beta [Rhodothermaceae bacterium]
MEAVDIDIKALYKALVLPRAIEEKMLRLIRQGRLAKWFSGYGQEAIAVGCVLGLNEDDYVLPMHRNVGVWTTRGVPLKPLFCQLMGREGGYTKGRDRTFHFGLLEKNLVGMISHLAAMLPVACGLGLSSQLAGTQRVALSMIGDGATREGDFHEALNLAAVWKLPVIFVIENNQYGLSTPVDDVFVGRNFAAAAAGYGMKGKVVDGNNIFKVIEVIQQAAYRARNGGGPTLVEMKTFRMRGHEEASGIKYVPKELFDKWGKKDPLLSLNKRILRDKLLPQDEMDTIKAEYEREVEEAAEYALSQPFVTSNRNDELRDVFAPSNVRALPAKGEKSVVRFIDAITQGLKQAMEEDSKIVVMGQDIAEYGGVFKVTAGFVEQFGKERVRNTPIIESGAIGAGVGLALGGYRPVVEMQYADFISCGFNQIVNNLATTHYRWGAPLPVTIRAPFGGHIGAGPFHSQSMEAWFCHVPGLKVVIPSSPYDAKGLLKAAIDDPNPVLFFEHKALYRSLKGEVPVEPYSIPLGSARVVLEGSDMTIVTYGIGVRWALEEAAFQQSQGHSIEIVDLRTLVPWDKETVFNSVRKTNKVLILHEAALTGGFGGEIAANIAEACFMDLDAPPARVAAENTPIPFSSTLEKDIYSPLPRLRPAIDALLQF